jgi:hypothetical protein
MEELIEFLQIDLEKDFGFHDDEAITALEQSMLELKKHKMELPKDPPSDSEKPARPFGFLLQADNISLSTTADGHSVAGSIVLRPDGMSIRSRLSSSLSDIAEDSLPEPKVHDDATELFEQLKFIDSFGSNINSKQQDQENPKQEKELEDDAQITQGNQSDIKEVSETSKERKHVFFEEQSSNKIEEETRLEKNGKIHPMAESPVGSPKDPVSVVVALKSSVSEDKEDLIQEWPVSNRVYYKASEVLPVVVKAEGGKVSPLPQVAASSPTSHDGQMRSKSSSPLNDSKPRQIKSPSRGTSIPKVIPPQKTSLVSPTHAVNKSFIPRVIKSPTINSTDRQDVTTISVGSDKTVVDQTPDKVRIFVPYQRSERSGSEGSRIRPPIRERSVLPAVDT